MYDFANSGYTTVVLTAVFSTYFVGVISADMTSGRGTFYWTVAMAIANILVALSAPVVGAFADLGAHKKLYLGITTLGCVGFTAALAVTGSGDVVLAMLLVITATVMFSAGENLIAAFLPEIAPPGEMGRISGYGWSLGYFGGLVVLAMCLAYVSWAQDKGQAATDYVPITMLITAGMFALAALPTFIWLRERTEAQGSKEKRTDLRQGLCRVYSTIKKVRYHRDLFRFLIAMTIYQSGVYTVIVLSAIYAQQVMGFSTRDTLLMIIVVNVTAAIGAFLFGRFQDRVGSVRTLAITLGVWILALTLAYLSTERLTFWIAANLIGLAMGSSQSAGRALVGQFSPAGHTAEYFGLWGLSVKLAAIIGPISYGLIALLTHNNHRLAILSTNAFFIIGLIFLMRVNEKRGRAAAIQRHY